MGTGHGAAAGRQRLRALASLRGVFWLADAAGPEGIGAVIDRCSCFDQLHAQASGTRADFHPDRQDTSAPGWLHLLALIDEAAADGREVFRPLAEMSPAEQRQVITLPPSIGKLTAVKQLVLYRSNLVRLPARIGAMASLEVFEPYNSRRLHWFPYELTRCKNLKYSTVSTRSLFGELQAPAAIPVAPALAIAVWRPGSRAVGTGHHYLVQRLRFPIHRMGNPPGVAVRMGRNGRAAAAGERLL